MAAPSFPAIGGFDFDNQQPSDRILALLNSTCSTGDGRLPSVLRVHHVGIGADGDTVAENLIVLFRAANLYISFRDYRGHLYMWFVADALNWPYNECATILNEYAAARKRYFAAVNLGVPEPSGRIARFICNLVDKFIATQEVRYASTRSRRKFFEEHRDYWEGVVFPSPMMFDPDYAFPALPLPADADWLDPSADSEEDGVLDTAAWVAEAYTLRPSELADMLHFDFGYVPIPALKPTSPLHAVMNWISLAKHEVLKMTGQCGGPFPDLLAALDDAKAKAEQAIATMNAERD